MLWIELESFHVFASPSYLLSADYGHKKKLFQTIVTMVIVYVGDRIQTESDEIGIICHIYPFVMRLDNFHSYCIFDPSRVRLLERAVDPEITIRPMLLKRIQDYIQASTSYEDIPTGE